MRMRALRGYTLVELAVSLVILGLLSVLIWRFGSVALQRMAQHAQPLTLEVADQALVGFAATHHRLPCPDTSATADGFEHCGGAAIGRLPVVTLGLARADLRAVRYGIFRDSATNLDVAIDRYPPLLTFSSASLDANIGYDFGSATAASTLLGSVNGNDFCHALRLAGALPRDASTLVNSLNVRGPGGTLVKNIAYAVSLPGVGSDPATNQNTVGNTFASPAQPISLGYQDTVLAVDFGQLFDRLSCGGVLSAADHAHFNAATAAALTHAEFVNYKSQLQIASELATANTLLAGASVAMATADILAASAEVAYDTAEALLTAGALAPILAAAVVNEAIAIAAEATAIAGVIIAADAEAGAKQAVLDFQVLLDDSAALEISIRSHAIAADAAGLY